MKPAKWTQVGKIVTDGENILKLGDVIGYELTPAMYNGKWRLIGATDEGELVIMSEYPVATMRLEGSRDYEQGTTLLNDFCKRFSRGKSAVFARSVNLEDVKQLSKYPELHNLIFGEHNEAAYWLATNYSSSKTPMLGMYAVKHGEIKGEILYSAANKYDYPVSNSIHAVVILSRNTKLFAKWQIG